MDGAEANRDGLAPAAVSLGAAELEAARYAFHRAHPARSARRVFHITQLLALAALGYGAWRAFVYAPALAFEVIHVTALALFAAAILLRLIAAARLKPVLSRLAAPADWPTYTILCPLYREAGVTPDLVAALARIDYPGTE